MSLNGVIISVSLSIAIASISYNCIDLTPIMSVGLSICRFVGLCVCPESVLWQNGWLDLDAVWDGEWDWSVDGCIRWGGNRWRGSFGGEFLAFHCNQWGLCCVVVRQRCTLLKLLWEYLFTKWLPDISLCHVPFHAHRWVAN